LNEKAKENGNLLLFQEDPNRVETKELDYQGFIPFHHVLNYQFLLLNEFILKRGLLTNNMKIKSPTMSSKSVSSYKCPNPIRRESASENEGGLRRKYG